MRNSKALEASFDTDPMDKHLAEKQVDIERIEDAVSHIRFPLTFSDQVYNLRSHIDIVRRKITLPAQMQRGGQRNSWDVRFGSMLSKKSFASLNTNPPSPKLKGVPDEWHLFRAVAH